MTDGTVTGSADKPKRIVVVEVEHGDELDADQSSLIIEQEKDGAIRLRWMASIHSKKHPKAWRGMDVMQSFKLGPGDMRKLSRVLGVEAKTPREQDKDRMAGMVVLAIVFALGALAGLGLAL